MASETTEGSKVEDEGDRGGLSPDQARRELEEQFNVQRARMKELFLQKEEDLQKVIQEKQQLESEVLGLRAEVEQLEILSTNQQSELKNLQLLVAETVEASSYGSEEARRLYSRNVELEKQLAQLKHQLQLQQQEVSLAPATLVRNIVKKLGADSDEPQQQPPRKNVEDGELYQSIIQPLDMEITALKNKLRETDAQLQEALKEKAQGNAPSLSSGDTKPIGAETHRQCDMCANYEKQLVSEQTAAETAKEKAKKLEQALKMATEELEGVRSIHDETIRSWHSERAASSQQLDELKAAVDEARSSLEKRVIEAQEASQRALEQVTTLTVHRETLQKKLDTCEQWAQYMFPGQNVSSKEFQMKLYNEHRMLCSKHFKREDFTDDSRKFLLRTAVPCDVLHHCSEAGVNIAATVCDMDGVNRRALSILGASTERPVITVGSKEIVTMYDVPHLLKCFRNLFMKYDIEFDTNIASTGKTGRGSNCVLWKRVIEAQEASQRALEQVTTLTVHRETLQKKLDTLERDNAVLVGQYTKKAQDMQNEIIDLPDNVTELQEVTLQLREQLIECAIGRERALEAEQELRQQLLQQGTAFHKQDSDLHAARQELRSAREELDHMQTEHAQMQELGDKLRQSNDMIEKLLNDKKRLHNEMAELRQRVSVLQQELDNSEKVQQDFVRLSQSLQVQLQRIREADTEVRWQHDEDVSECPSCHTPLPNSKKKVHCRHCGRIFCGSCCAHTVVSGPRQLPARVCAVCRTLLQPHTAPYFSTQPPHSPD